jgi:hypothetical protein
MDKAKTEGLSDYRAKLFENIERGLGVSKLFASL